MYNHKNTMIIGAFTVVIIVCNIGMICQIAMAFFTHKELSIIYRQATFFITAKAASHGDFYTLTYSLDSHYSF